MNSVSLYSLSFFNPSFVNIRAFIFFCDIFLSFPLLFSFLLSDQSFLQGRWTFFSFSIGKYALIVFDFSQSIWTVNPSE